MGQQLRVADDLATLHDYTFAAGTTGSISTHVSAALDLGAADVDEESPGEIVVSLPDMTSGGSATVNVQVFDCDTVGGSYAALTPYLIETGVQDFDDAIWDENGGKLRLALPAYGMRQFIQVNVVIAVATVTGGVADIWFARTPK